MDLSEVLQQLTEGAGVSGAEAGTAKVIEKYLSEYGKTYTDRLGNLICELDGEGEPFLLSAHMDRVGMIVTYITDEGFLRVDNCGRIDNRTLCAQQVTVHAKEELKGVVISTPPHLQGADTKRKALNTNEALIDIGLSAERARELVALGDRVTVDSAFLSLAGDRFACHAFDDRAGVASILYALEILRERENSRKITVAFTTREETGGSGARVASFNSDASELIAVDVSFAKTPDSKAEECGVLGKGPMIGIAPSLDCEASEKLRQLAVEKNIPYQLEIMSGMTGTDADSMTCAADGLVSLLISIPLRYMHTGVEVISLSDIENTGSLIAEYILSGGAVNA